MDRAVLDVVLERHAAWLCGEAGGERANLSGADLRCTDLKRADLRDANLRGVNLRGADLRGADLVGADLWDADLLRTDLSGANLWDTDLRCANLSGARLTGARVYPVAADRCIGVDIRIYSPGRHRIVAVWIIDRVIVQIGCEQHSLDHWLLEYRRIGEAAGYPVPVIDEYGETLRFIATIWGEYARAKGT